MIRTSASVVDRMPDGIGSADPAGAREVQPPATKFSRARGRSSTLSVGRVQAVWAGIATSALLVLWGEPLALAPLCLALAVMASAVLTRPSSPRGWSLASSLPAGFVLIVVWALIWGLLGGAVGVEAWGSRPLSIAGVASFAFLTGVLARFRGGRILVVGRDATAGWGFLALVLFFAWVVISQPLASWSRVNSAGTDFLRHLRFIRLVRADGALEPGEVMYPRAFHAVGSWLTSALGAATDAGSLWRSMAPLGFLMLALMLLGIMVIALRITDHVAGRSWLGSGAAWVAAVAFLQTAWFDTFLALGNVMNMIAALGLLTVLIAGLESRTTAQLGTWIVCASVLALVANAYQLVFPIAAAGTMPWIITFLRHGSRSLAGWSAWIASAALVFHGLGLRPSGGGRTASAVTASTSAPSVSLLYRPEWWWWVAIAVSWVAALALFRSGRRSLAASYALMLVSAAIVVGVLVRTTGSSWDLLRYYPVKTLWTAMVVVIPVAAAGAFILGSLVWRRTKSLAPSAQVPLRGMAALTVGVILVGAAGRGAAFPPHLQQIADGRAGPPNWSLALIETLDARPSAGGPELGALVFGLVPSAEADAVRGGYVGIVDLMGMEALEHLGWDLAFADPVKVSLATRDVDGVCTYLKENESALRVTGPNPDAGPQWLMDAGCPEEVVAPESWISLQLDPSWLANSPWQDGEWQFPTFDQVYGEVDDVAPDA